MMGDHSTHMNHRNDGALREGEVRLWPGWGGVTKAAAIEGGCKEG